jgi:16S rRNA (uracil1498-N3)-methyltransferase
LSRRGSAGAREAAIPSRLYAPELGAAGSVLELSPEEAHYVARVCRARAGDLAEATDGRGVIARLELVSVGTGVRAEVLSVDQARRERRTWLWCGAPERGRADWLVEKLAELGVERFQPLDCQGEPWAAGEARSRRWNRLAVAALRQSRRAFLMAIGSPLPLEVALETIEPAAALWVGDPAGRPAARGERPASLEVGAIGPSGGFAARDRERLEAAGFVPIALADGRLRTETAALSLASWLALPQRPGVDA